MISPWGGGDGGLSEGHLFPLLLLWWWSSSAANGEHSRFLLFIVYESQFDEFSVLGTFCEQFTGLNGKGNQVKQVSCYTITVQYIDSCKDAVKA